MQYAINIAKPWRYRDRARGAQQIQPGRYRVPEDLPAPVAALAIDQGMARRETVSESAEHDAVKRLEQTISPQAEGLSGEAVKESLVEPVSDGFVADKTKLGRKPRRKRPAPQNKRLHVAENKSTLV